MFACPHNQIFHYKMKINKSSLYGTSTSFYPAFKIAELFPRA